MQYTHISRRHLMVIRAVPFLFCFFLETVCGTRNINDTELNRSILLCIKSAFVSEYFTFLVWPLVFFRTLDCVAHWELACTPRRKFEPRPKSRILANNYGQSFRFALNRAKQDNGDPTISEIFVCCWLLRQYNVWTRRPSNSLQMQFRHSNSSSSRSPLCDGHG